MMGYLNYSFTDAMKFDDTIPDRNIGYNNQVLNALLLLGGETGS